MRKTYEEPKAKLILLVCEDVLTESADFVDPETGDNGVEWPGNEK